MNEIREIDYIIKVKLKDMPDTLPIDVSMFEIHKLKNYRKNLADKLFLYIRKRIKKC